MAKERLTEDRKQQLEDLYNNLHRHNFYTILDVAHDADREAIRKAYFSISKLCHPDNYADKDLGPHRTYMEKIFQACSKAYDVLGNSDKRTRYDAYLEKKKDTANYATNVLQQEAGLSKALEEAARKASEQEQFIHSQPPPVEIPEQPAAEPAPPPAGAGASPTPTPPPSRPSRPSSIDDETRQRYDRRRRSWTRDSARRRLLGVVGHVKADESVDRSRSWVAKARKAQEEGQTLAAINALRMATNLDPGNEEARKLLDEALQTASGELGQRYFDQARSEVEFGDPREALASIERAVNLCPETPAYLALAATILLESDGDLHKAYEYAQRAARIESRTATHFLLLGKILLKAGLQARARSALARAYELNPKLKEAKGLIGRL